MTKDKWLQIFDEEFIKASGDSISPENWIKYKPILLNFIKEVDKATEVYEMENKK